MSASCAEIENPVDKSAVIELDSSCGGGAIVNVFSADTEGKAIDGKPEIIIIKKGCSKSALDKLSSGAKLSPGNYIMNVVAGAETARVFFKSNSEIVKQEY